MMKPKTPHKHMLYGMTFILVGLVVIAGLMTATHSAAESQLRQAQPKPGFWEGSSVSFFVNPDGSIRDFSLHADMVTSWCIIKANTLREQTPGRLEFVELYPEANYWYDDLSTHAERLARADEQGVAWPETVETENGYMIKSINIVGTFTSETTLEGTYQVHICNDQLYLHMQSEGLNEWSAAWVSETDNALSPNAATTMQPELSAPDMTATYEQLMADALATVTASSWTATPPPTNTPTFTPSATYTPTVTPSPTSTPIPPQKISAANLAWLEEKVWVKIFGDPEEIYWSMDGKTLVTTTGFAAALFDATNLQEEPFRKKQTAGFVNAVAVSPDGITAAYGDGEDNVVLWNLHTDAETPLRGHTNSVQGLAFSADGTRLASASWDTTVRIWDVATGDELAFFTGFTNFAYEVAFRPDGQVLAAVGQHYPDEGVRLWNAQTFEELPMLSTDDSLACLAFSPDGRFLAAGEEWDLQWYLWDAQSFERVLTLGQSTWEAEGGMCSVTFSPDSTLMATGGGDNLIHIWDVAAGSATFGQELATLRRHTDTVVSLAFSPDGTMLASGGGHNDSTIRLWGISTSAPLADTTAPVVPNTASDSAPSTASEVVPTPATGEQAANPGTCTVTTQNMLMVFAQPSLEAGAPAVIDPGTTLILNAWITDENGLVWYHTQDNQWGIREIIFPFGDVPVECANLPPFDSP